MKKLTIVAVATGLSAAVLGLNAPAEAAPSQGDAQQIIMEIEANGNRVVVNRQSSTPLSEATVVSVRPGPAIRQWVTVNGRQGDDRHRGDRVLQTVGKVYFVDVK